jgi:hypothetical protein
MCRRAAVAGLAAGLAVGATGAAVASEISPPAANAPPEAPGATPQPVAPATTAQPAVRRDVVKARVHVPRGILANVPSGGDPNFRYRRLAYAAPPVVFAPAIVVPTIVVAPPIYELAPPVDAFVSFDFWPCFVPTEHAGQFGHYGSCAESYFRQFTNRPD